LHQVEDGVGLASVQSTKEEIRQKYRIAEAFFLFKQRLKNVASIMFLVEASVKVKFVHVYNSAMTYSAHLHTDYEHAQTFFSLVVVLGIFL
jgi:hypothetical protein